jgi:hypothetical protein
MLKHKCKLAGINEAPFSTFDDCPHLDEATRRADYIPSAQTEAAVVALFAYAKALRNAHQVLCAGQPGLCPAMFNITSKEFFMDFMKRNEFIFEWQERIPSLASSNLEPFLRPKSVAFDSSQEIRDSVYSILNFNNKSGMFQLTQVSWKYNCFFSSTINLQVGIFQDSAMSMTTNRLQFYSANRLQTLTTPPSFPCLYPRCADCQHSSNANWTSPTVFYTAGPRGTS